MKYYICLFWIVYFAGICSICISQETASGEEIWEPQASIWVDISGSMNRRLPAVKRDLENMLEYGQIRASSINGFYSRREEYRAEVLSDLNSLEIPEDPITTFSPLEKGLEFGIEEIKGYKDPGSTILFLATDEKKHESGSEVAGKNVFRDILMKEEQCPWVFYFDDKKTANGNQNPGYDYRIYIMIHYIPEETEVIQQERTVKRFLEFLDDLSRKFGRKAVLLKFHYPERTPIFKADPTMGYWEKWQCGREIDSDYSYRFSYIPRSYRLKEGVFTIDSEDAKKPLKVTGFSNCRYVQPIDYQVRIRGGRGGGSDTTISLPTISKGESIDIRLKLLIPTPEWSWEDLLSLQSGGAIVGSVVGKVFDAAFNPLQEDYPNLAISEAQDRIEGSAPYPVTIGFRYDVRYPKWFWPARIFVMFGIAALLMFLVLLMRSLRRASEVEIVVDSVPVSTMDLKRENSRSVGMKLGGQDVVLGRIRRSGSRRLNFSPSEIIDQVDEKKVENDKIWRIRMKRQMDLKLSAEAGASAESVSLVLRPVSQQNEEKSKTSGLSSSGTQDSDDQLFTYNPKSEV